MPTLAQILALILVEKVALLFFPRMNQKLERFYKAVVEEALLGKDPDVAEDFHGPTFSMVPNFINKPPRNVVKKK